MAYYEQLDTNKYRLCARDPSAIGRKRRSKTVQVPPDIARSERKKKHWLDLELAKYAESVESGTLVRFEKMTVDQFIPKWNSGFAKQHMGGYTRRNVLSTIKTHLLPAFGSSQLDQIKPLHLVTFFAELKRKDGQPMATNTKLNIYKAAKSIFDAAHEWQLIAKNPMEGVKRPSPDKQEKRAMRQKKKSYTRSEADVILTALYSEPSHWRHYFTGVLLGGFRRGEMLAVEWTHVDYESGGIHITKQITFDENGKKTEGELKTEESEGFIPMPSWYMAELKQYHRKWKLEKMRCKDWRGGDKQYVFHSGSGEIYYPNTPSLTWRRFLARHELPTVRLHDLRHTTAMLLRESGADLKTIQERLRHTKLNTTTDIYMQESTLVSRDAADRLESLNPKTSKTAT